MPGVPRGAEEREAAGREEDVVDMSDRPLGTGPRRSLSVDRSYELLNELEAKVVQFEHDAGEIVAELIAS